MRHLEGLGVCFDCSPYESTTQLLDSRCVHIIECLFNHMGLARRKAASQWVVVGLRVLATQFESSCFVCLGYSGAHTHTKIDGSNYDARTIDTTHTRKMPELTVQIQSPHHLYTHIQPNRKKEIHFVLAIHGFEEGESPVGFSYQPFAENCVLV